MSTRLIVTKMYRATEYDATGRPVYAYQSQTLFFTAAPSELKGEPSNPLPMSPNIADYNVTPIDFDLVGHEEWNVYDLADGTQLRVKLDIVNVVKTDKFTVDGDPYYIVTPTTTFRVRVPPTLLKKQVPHAVSKGDVYR